MARLVLEVHDTALLPHDKTKHRFEQLQVRVENTYVLTAQPEA